eukprot:14707688-Ditylum_brightwellii.AAC.1
MNLVNWDNLGTALDCQCLESKVQLVKSMHNLLNTGYQKLNFDEEDVADCPICHSAKETWTHIFQCQHSDFIVTQNLAITVFKSKLLRLETVQIITTSPVL